ncbi:hypothetical protein [Sulfuracidifex tepidarius]|uniref:Uncharacterized protein n=1 Tax=Sulfuracidifex tepidarius TaxID=1294262 RepID=A0A510E4Q5_9CREN|nr:hypothetical protein [Sulfuracidifex tepidarius]BBG24727.1 hypothetical protein IC006_2061 [Sulfuracidifex tepidarius]BBG27515.1 hypothetical protein IC007_2069 [Sulfuracidifex tepidarius]
MESKYSEIVKVNLPRGVLIKIISNPFVFMSVTTHFVVLRKLENGNYLASLINDGEIGKTKQESYYGEILPASMVGSTVIYKGESFDKKIRLEASVDLSFFAKDGSVNISMTISTEDKGLLGWGKAKFPITAEHVIKGHVIPNIKNFSCLINEMNESWTVDPIDVAKYVMMKAKQIESGLILVHNCSTYASFKVEDGQISKASGKFGNLLITGNDVLMKLLQEKEKLTLEIADPSMFKIIEVVNEVL